MVLCPMKITSSHPFTSFKARKRIRQERGKFSNYQKFTNDSYCQVETVMKLDKTSLVRINLVRCLKVEITVCLGKGERVHRERQT